MRSIFFLIVLLTFGLCSDAQIKQPKNVFRSGGYFEIAGKIKNYNNSDKRIITFRTFDIRGVYKDTISLPDKNGLFSITLFQPFAGGIDFRYNGYWSTLYIPRRKKIQLEIDDSVWNSDPIKSNAIAISGEEGIITKLILDYNDKFKKQIFTTTVNWEDSSLNDEVVANIRIKRMKEELTFLKNYISKNRITKSDFINWARNEIYYTAGNDILFESFSSSRNKSLTDQQLMKILQDVPLNNYSAFYNPSYYSFLRSLTSDLIIIVNINPIYKDAAIPYGMNYIPVYLQKIDEYSKGIAKELMYYDLYFGNSPKKTDYYLENFQSTIKEPYIKQQFNEKKEKFFKPFEPYDLIKKLRQNKFDDSLESRLINIFDSEKNNYVFLDFWGDWCMPCMKEMPFYPILIDQFKEQNVSFIFFGVKTDEEKAAEIKNKYGINGKFVMLNDIEENIMRNALDFTGYPSHFVLQPGVLVIDDTIAKITWMTTDGTKLNDSVVEKLKKYFLPSKKRL